MYQLLKFSDEKYSLTLNARNADARTSNRFTVVIGENGSGKTGLLTALVDSLVPAEKKVSGPPSVVHALRPPTAVFAVCNLVTDSFVSTSTPVGLPFATRYRYLGLRQGRNMISTGALRDVTSQFLAKCLADPERAYMLEPVLGLLKCTGCRVRFQVPKSGRRTDMYQSVRSSGGVRSLDLNEEKIAGFLEEIESFRHLIRSKANDRDSENEPLNFLSRLARTFEIDLADLVWFVKRVGVATALAEVQTSRGWVAVDDLSNGQLLLLSMVARIAASIEEDSLVIIDEPEIGLHPSWQSDFIPLLEATIPGRFGCHFLIATHSPHIVSDGSDILVPGGKWGRFENFDDLFRGRSVENLLYRVFETRVSGNKAVDDDLARLLNLIGQRELTNQSLAGIEETIARLEKIADTDTTELNIILRQARVIVESRS